MPELPEVETVRRGLEAHLLGRRIMKVTARRLDLRTPIPPSLAEVLTGRMLEAVDRRAKYLLLYFSGAAVLLIHLGMSGTLLLHRGGHARKPSLGTHDHVVFVFSGGARLVFRDPRRFGLLALTTRKALAAERLLAHLGPEPLARSFGGAILHSILRSRRAPVKSVIMDQRRVAGVGNIYACEVLFRARIRPSRQAFRVSAAEAVRLADAIRDVLLEAIEAGGSTLKDYAQVSGDGGYFQHRFRVYGRAGKPCPSCGRPIRVRRLAGRSTFFCSSCQK